MNRPVVARLDRLRVISWAKRYWKLRPIPGFRVVRDTRVKPQGKSPTYERVRELASLTSGTEIWWQYRRRRAWLKEWRITWVADDQKGIQPAEILQILKGCRYFRFVLVEFALDFDPDSGVNRRFVKRHGRFGKSHRRKDRGGPGQLRYGSRKSGKLVRCYWKKEVNAFRVELELHGRILAKGRHPKHRNYNMADVPNTILPDHVRDHVRFVRFDWNVLERYLIERFGDEGHSILEKARVKARISLRFVTRFLQKREVPNIHRFLVPMRINAAVDEAITRWAVRFQSEWSKVI
jgi:hypothetical protein